MSQDGQANTAPYSSVMMPTTSTEISTADVGNVTAWYCKNRTNVMKQNAVHVTISHNNGTHKILNSSVKA